MEYYNSMLSFLGYVFDIMLDLRSRAISNFPATAGSIYKAKETEHVIIFCMYETLNLILDLFYGYFGGKSFNLDI